MINDFQFDLNEMARNTSCKPDEANHFQPENSLSILGIVVALPEEVETLTKQKLRQGELLHLHKNILLVYSGTGYENAKLAVEQLISNGANCLVSWGCAAALSPILRPGDLLLPDYVLNGNQISMPTDKVWQEKFVNVFLDKLNFKSGTLAHANYIVAKREEKQLLHQLTGAYALDMESAAVYECAKQANLPCIAIRSIADPVTMNLPNAINFALNNVGQVEINKLLRYLIFNPWEIPSLIQLGLCFNQAQRSLKKVAKELLKVI